MAAADGGKHAYYDLRGFPSMAWRSPQRGNDQSLVARSKQRRALAQRGRLADLSRVYDYGQPRNYTYAASCACCWAIVKVIVFARDSARYQAWRSATNGSLLRSRNS